MFLAGGRTTGVDLVAEFGERRCVNLSAPDSPAGRPTPIDVPVVLQNVKTRCTPAYQNLF